MEEVIFQNSEYGWFALVDKKSSIGKLNDLLVFITQTSE